MKLLLVAATEAEIAPALARLRQGAQHRMAQVQVCITGVGLPAAIFALTRQLHCSGGPLFDFVLQAGIAGSFCPSFPPGSVAIVRSDCFGDLGAEDGADFLDIFRLGLANPHQGLFQDRRLVNDFAGCPFPLKKIPVADAITVNTVTGSDATATARKTLWNAHLESMEGAALHYVCRLAGQRFLQLRAVSNYAERRNRQAWKVNEAINALDAQLQEWLW